MTRLDSLRKIAFVEHGFDGYLIFNDANLTYFLGFQGPAALLVPPRGEAVVYVEAKNYEAAKVEGKSFRIEKFVPTDNLIMKIAKDVKACEIQHLAIDSLTVSEWQFLVKEFPKENAIVLNNGIVESLRRVKTVQEIELMRIAGKITSEGMRTAFEFIQAGVKEYEVAAEIEYAMRKCGSGPTAFESIVASGIYSAFPHGGCSDRVICEGDLVVVDIGATYK
ncbi:MAG: aminopeptidase P family protein, partial [Crenarchaeota archaeon]|nr:aminopeptidase P family protein [Thermoproteota archaeon]